MFGTDPNAKSRNWFATNNNPLIDCDEYLLSVHQSSGAVYTCGQLEKAESGTLHIQFYINFKEPKRFAAMKKLDDSVHWEIVKINAAAIQYCMKEESRVLGPYEYGTRPKVN